MTRIKITLAALFISITIIWFLTNTLLYIPFDYDLFTKSLDQFTGVIAFSAMTFSMILATRHLWLEKRLNGLDKIYRLHKWLGIIAFSFSIMHWLVAKLPDWWLRLDNLITLDAISGATVSDTEPSAFEQLLETLEVSAHQVGEYAFYLTVLFLIMALLKKIPYHIFAKTHIVMAVIYLALVFHSFALMYIEYWTEPIGITMAILMVLGTVSSVIVLLGQVGKKQKTEGFIQSIKSYSDMNMFELIVRSDKWKGHNAGQFAFLKLEKREPSHPFTISSAWDRNTPNISFTIKALGDYTNTLANKLKIGDSIVVEGPYGNFTFNDNKESQIWIGGGVGITPFLARMEGLGQLSNMQKIDFFYAAYKLDATLEGQLQQLATAANINLHLFEASKSALISGEHIRNTISDWVSASVWFCGPSKMGKSIKKDFKTNGFKAKFHQELFEMR
ncbi:ferredoxin reductase family protein [Saccharicrinis fermentans]|uniref:Anthranilate 1,2-dioxygenase electron transfer component n=1 Tax=Saccharicrinis fermentans DSM 9555 = JCM 21142 TaxID=869213 RepID=W7YF73_9BACT|nr:ferric reductase-like transmembrane domain-containing protein [Saccharicrinis fermentans]GAF03096.1 anthranilate 1,2-dioxygenase electron transfer component [Saccharicrinis fermentans DSM 9555 = JCM 21142]